MPDTSTLPPPHDLLVLLGPTASGKTRLAVQAALLRGPLKLGDGFAIPLSRSGLVAVAITMKNGGDHALGVSAFDVRLILAGSRTISTATLPLVESQLGMGSDLVIRDAEHGAVVKRLNLQDALKARALGEWKLAPGQAAEGLVFFAPAEALTPAGLALSLWAMDEGERRAWRVAVPIALPDPVPAKEAP